MGNKSRPMPGGQEFAGPFSTADPEAIELFRQTLETHGFSEAGVREAVGEQTDRLQLKRIDFPLYQRRLAGRRPLNSLIKIFMMQLWVEPAEAQAALAPLELERLVALGLLESGAQGIHSRCALSICDGLIIAHDRVEQEGAEPEADYVLGVNPSAFACHHQYDGQFREWPGQQNGPSRAHGVYYRETRGQGVTEVIGRGLCR